MEVITLVLSVISTSAAVVSAVIAVKAKNEAKIILQNITSTNTPIANSGVNDGIIIGSNSGEVNNVK